jgi:tRNA pseudouridine38-40 synthase
MQQAAHLFLGTRDFTSFANNNGKKGGNGVRTLRRLHMSQKGPQLLIELEANGFLYRMARNIVGTLMEVGKGKQSLDSIRGMFEGNNRALAGMAAPAHGLCLVEVQYF